MKNPLNILQISSNDGFGGAEKSALLLFNKYREIGHQSWLIVGKKTTNDPDIYEIIKHENITSLYKSSNHETNLIYKIFDRLIPTKMGSRYYFHDLSNGAPQIQKIIQYERGWEEFNYPGTWHLLDLPPGQPNIVHLHNLHGYYFDLRYLPKLSRQVPVILNLRDMWTLTGHCAYPINCTHWKQGCGNCPDLKIYPPIARDATRFNYRRKKNIFSHSRLFITTPTKWLMDQVLFSQMFSAIEYRVIPNAINLDTFHPGEKYLARKVLDLPQETQIVLFLSHSEFKDFETMHAALNYIHKGQKKLLFICIGKDGVKELIGEGELIYTGRISDENKMVLYYQAADVYIHAAHHEVFGKSMVEAMACGVPVVATAVDGIPEVIEDGMTGFLAPGKDRYALAAKVNLLLEDPNLRNEMGINSSKHARRLFNLERQANDFLDWYQEILENK
jgi:glycosyltransferase involved in cell wall biosynthesis